jgi:hypothetical protein
MNELDILSQLGAKAQNATAPRIDAVPGVLARIQEPQPIPLAAWWAAAGVATGLAAAAAIAAVWSWQLAQEPLTHWLAPLEMVLQ